MEGNIEMVTGLIIVASVIFIYFIPAIFAYRHAHPNTGAILAINLLAGWTLLGWIAAAIWAITPKREQ